ncbi:unnamed protein product [Paramecium sonneborni]|uniref:Uncharacterized protein n=1 Tax=Paramecium sonneborni TaxID=65129 RepID=A0A8S1PI98_9CILI|nr:unnamed protein product [Paramecium sonneborni]
MQFQQCQSISSKMERLIGHKSAIDYIHFSHNGLMVLKIITFISISENKVNTLSGQSDQVNSILFKKNDQTLISQVNINQLNFGITRNKLQLLSDGQTLISCVRDSMILVRSMREGKYIKCIEKISNNKCFSYDDKLLAQQSQNEIQLWNISVWKIISFRGGQPIKIQSFVFNLEIQYQLLFVMVKKQFVYGMQKYKKIQNNLISINQEFNMQDSPDNKIIYLQVRIKLLDCWIQKKGNLIYLWYYKEGRLITLKEENIMQTTIKVLLFNQMELYWDEDHLQIKNYKILIKFNEKKELAILSVSQSMEKLKFSPNGQLQVSVSFDSQAQLWDMKQYSSLVVLDEVNDVVIRLLPCMDINIQLIRFYFHLMAVTYHLEIQTLLLFYGVLIILNNMLYQKVINNLQRELLFHRRVAYYHPYAQNQQEFGILDLQNKYHK